MKKLAIIFLSATLLSSPILADNAKILATYNGGEVTEQQVMQQFESILAMQPENKGKKFSDFDKNMQELLVRGYINSKLFEKEAETLGIRNTPAFKEKLKVVESQMVQQELIENYVTSKVTDKMLDDEYNQLVKNLKGQEEVKTAHILVDTEEKAKEIKRKLNKGSKFNDLVQQFSNDEASKANGGEIGYVIKGRLVPEFETKAFSMKKDEISDPVKTQFGWHVIKMLDKRPVVVPTKAQALPELKAKLSREVIEKYFNDLASKANIELKL